MAKVRNYHYYGTAEKVNALADDYRFLGREAEVVEPGHLVVYALPRPKPSKKAVEDEKAEKEKVSRKNTYRSSK